MQEREKSRSLDLQILAPVLFSIPGGWLNVMPRCEPISRDDFDSIITEIMIMNATLPVEEKLDSFGWYQDRIVAVDYGG